MRKQASSVLDPRGASTTHPSPVSEGTGSVLAGYREDTLLGSGAAGGGYSWRLDEDQMECWPGSHTPPVAILSGRQSLRVPEALPPGRAGWVEGEARGGKR